MAKESSRDVGTCAGGIWRTRTAGSSATRDTGVYLRKHHSPARPVPKRPAAPPIPPIDLAAMPPALIQRTESTRRDRLIRSLIAATVPFVVLVTYLALTDVTADRDASAQSLPTVSLVSVSPSPVQEGARLTVTVRISEPASGDIYSGGRHQGIRFVERFVGEWLRRRSDQVGVQGRTRDPEHDICPTRRWRDDDGSNGLHRPPSRAGTITTSPFPQR